MATATKKKTATKTVAKKASAEKVTATKAVKPISHNIPKPTKEEMAAEKKHRDESNKLMKIYSSVIVPTWFGHKAVETSINGPIALRPEAALCLVYIGVCQGTPGCSEVGIQINLRPSGFDRKEASLFADLGCATLRGHKFAKYEKKLKEGENPALANQILTAKGQKYFDLIKRVVLQEPGKGSFMI